MTDVDLVPPHDLAAENSVIGAVLKSPNAIAHAFDLAAEDFYTPKLRAIWRAMQDLWQRNIPIDHATLSHRLEAPDLAAVGVTLLDLADIDLAVPSASHIEHYAKIVSDCATQRRYAHAAQQIAELSWRSGADIDRLTQQIETLLATARPRAMRRDLFDPERWAEMFMADIERRQSGERTAVTTGLHNLDEMTLGLEAGGLYLLMATPGVGKALAVNTLLPTPYGWLTMREVRVGDELFDECGEPCRVTYTSGVQFDRPCYEVEFSDGSTIVADAEHRWFTSADNERHVLSHRVDNPTTRRSAWSRLPAGAVRTTEDIARTIRRNDGGLNHSVAVAGQLVTPHADLPLDPYVLGVWLGDGSSYRADICVADPEIAGQVVAAGHRITLRKAPPDKTPSYGISELHAQLQRLDLYKNKHIPLIYQRAAIEQRLALLQGLMDTDGYCAKNGLTQFSSTSKKLATNVYELVCSLGIKATVTTKPCNGRTAESSIAYTVGFTTSTPVFRLPRKLARQNLMVRSTQQRRYITAVRRVESVPVQCIQVDSPSHQFLVGRSCIPTHNTELAMQIGIHVAKQHGTVLFASLEMSAVELAHRYARIVHGIDRNRLAKGTLTDDESSQVILVLNDMRDSRFWPSSPRKQYTTVDLRADALDVQSRTGHVALIVADYVQRFSDGDGIPAHREINVGMTAAGLKSLAREFQCPVLAPVQPNREYVSRSDKRPVLSDLRESGKLEQEADMVLGLYRDEKHEPNTNDRGITEVHMLKNRSGVGDPDGSRRLVWLGTRYGDLTTRLQPPQWQDAV